MGAQRNLFDPGRSLPDGLVYRADFLDPGEERALIAAVERLPLTEARYKQYTAKRRIVAYGAGYDFDQNALEPAPPAPDFLYPLRARLTALAGIAADAFQYAVVAEYRTGTTLGWHRDAPSFELVAGVSLASSCRMRFRRYPPRARATEPGFELLLAPRSAYVLRGDVRWRWQHQIPPTKALRYSITFRTARGTF